MIFSEIISLSECEPIAEGGRRSVYVFPGQSEYLIKVAIPNKTPKQLPLWKRIVRRFFPDIGYKHTLKEIESEAKTALKLGASIAQSPLARSLGVIQTDLGPGVVVERISGADGNLAATLKSLKNSGGLTGDVVEDLNVFIKKLFSLQVVASDIHARNIAYGCRNGTKAFFLIDGYGERNMIPVRAMFRVVNDYQLSKRIKRTAASVGLEWDARTHEFSLSKE